MADLESHLNEEHPELSGESRRALLKKLGIGVGAAWVAPTIISSAASAQGTPSPNYPQRCPLCGAGNLQVNGDAELGDTVNDPPSGWLYPPFLLPPGVLTTVPNGSPFPGDATDGNFIFKLDGPQTPGIGGVLGVALPDAGCHNLTWRMTAKAAAYPAVGPALPSQPPFPPGTVPSQAMFFIFADINTLAPVKMRVVPITTTTMDSYTITLKQPVSADPLAAAWGFWAFNGGVAMFSTLFDNVSVTVDC